MKNIKSKIFIFISSLLLISLANISTLLASVLFEEDFSSLDNWYLVVYDSAKGSANDPPPVLDHSMGLDPPSLDVNGDSWCGDGAYSRQTFDYSRGLIIEWDMYVADKRYEGCWVEGKFGLADHQVNLEHPRNDGAYVDPNHCDPVYAAGIVLNVVGPLCWGATSEMLNHAYLYFLIRTESGEIEKFDVIGEWADDLLGEWHHYKIWIKSDGYVEFYIDGELKWRSTQRIDRSLGSLPVLAGTRDAYGPVRIDNVRVLSEEEECNDRYDEGFEAGKQWCREHPQECGIEIPSDCVATFDMTTNTLLVPNFENRYWLEFGLINWDPVQLQLKRYGPLNERER